MSFSKLRDGRLVTLIVLLDHLYLMCPCEEALRSKVVVS